MVAVTSSSPLTISGSLPHIRSLATMADLNSVPGSKPLTTSCIKYNELIAAAPIACLRPLLMYAFRTPRLHFRNVSSGLRSLARVMFSSCSSNAFFIDLNRLSQSSNTTADGCVC
eukprot:7309019-Pyramimonas_sp.AAC.2